MDSIENKEPVEENRIKGYIGQKVYVKDVMHRRSEAPLYSVFPYAQVKALDMITQQRPMHGTLFSYDRIRITKGERKDVKGFITVGWREFFKRYKLFSPDQRIIYENIMPGTKSNTLYDPNTSKAKTSDQCFIDWTDEELQVQSLCHFFGDVDILLAYNKHLDAESTFSKLIQEMTAYYQFYFDEDEPIVLVSDSTGDTPLGKKFSRHFLIKSASGRMFSSAAHAGAFMRCFAYEMCKKYGPPETNMFFASKGPEDGFEFVLDLGVNTKYRGFRLIFSSKINKKRWLRPIGNWMAGVRDVADMTYEQFLDTLVQYSPHDEVDVLYAYEPDGGDARWTSDPILSIVEWVDGKIRLRDRSRVTTHKRLRNGEAKLKYREDVDGEEWNVDVEHARVMTHLLRNNNDRTIPDFIIQTANFVADSWYKGDSPGEIYIISPTTFSFSSYQHCDALCPHVQRAHKSNRIKYLVSLRDRDGMFRIASYTSCFDVDCPNHYIFTKVWTRQNMGEKLYDALLEYNDHLWDQAKVDGNDVKMLF